jgi:hypothetical protein
MNAKEIFEKLIDRAFQWSLFSSRRPTKPGELIERLPPEEREELQNLTSKDTKEVDHRLMYLHDPSKPTVTVHKLFPSKKDEEDES